MKLTATGLSFGEAPDPDFKDLPNTHYMNVLKESFRNDPVVDGALKEVCVKGQMSGLSIDQTAGIMVELLKMHREELTSTKIEYEEFIEIVRQLVVEYMSKIT